MTGTTQYTVELADNIPDFWALSDHQLATSCVRIAEGRFPGSKPFLRAEAMRLFLLWRETVNANSRTRHEMEQRACTIAALRKRTIQILVRLSLPAQYASRPA